MVMSAHSVPTPKYILGLTNTWTAQQTFEGGDLRLKNDAFLVGRNAADSADLNMWKVNTSNELESGIATVNLGASPTLKASSGDLLLDAAGNIVVNDQLETRNGNILRDITSGVISIIGSTGTINAGTVRVTGPDHASAPGIADLLYNNITRIRVDATGIGFYGATPVAQQSTIADADGTLADVTTKFNNLLFKMEAYGLLASA